MKFKSIIKSGLILSSLLNSCSETVAEEWHVDVIPEPMEINFEKGCFETPDGTSGKLEDYIKIEKSENFRQKLGEEGYMLRVGQSQIEISAADERGVFYAKETLKQLNNGRQLPCVSITDIPRSPYRGIHLDVSRHFFPKEDILKLLDEMARYKLNCFHFHLTDNGGWRFQSEKYPELTAKGAYRTQKDWYEWFDCRDRHFVEEGSEGAYGGYYTKQDLKEIVRFASRRNIIVIPEIEFPAHSDAVFAARPDLCCAGKAYTSGEFCAGNEKVYEFMEDILSEVMEIFPSKYIHIGGDEARHDAWKVCPSCGELMRREDMKRGVTDIQPYMIKRIESFIRSKSRTMIGWDEILHGNIDSSTVVMSYRGQKGAIESANRGNPAVMTPGEILYFDWYQADPSKEPRAMCGFSPIKKMYSIEPVPDTREKAARNESLIKAARVEPDDVDFIKPGNTGKIIGVQGCMWTEYIESQSHLEYMIFPRLLAVSEIAWTSQENRDWDDFKRRVSKHIPELKARGVNTFELSNDVEITSHVDVPDKTSSVCLDCEKWGVDIRYTVDGSRPDGSSSLYKSSFNVPDSTLVRAAVFIDGKMQEPVSEMLVTVSSDVENFFPFMAPDIWRQ